MIRDLLFLLSICLGMASTAAPCFAQAKPDAKPAEKLPAKEPIRILFVGNSYTSVNNLPAMVRELAAAGKGLRSITVEAVTPGGCSFQRHIDDEKFGTKKAIAEGKWDYVVLQEQSQMPFSFPDATLDYGKRLGALIKEKNARPLLYLTWAREHQQENQKKLNDTYVKLGQALDAAVVPVGPAWEKARAQRSDLPLYLKDQSHPSPAGTYLAACVFHGAIHEQSPVGLPRKIAGAGNRPLADLPEKDAAFLQAVAWETVQVWKKKP